MTRQIGRRRIVVAVVLAAALAPAGSSAGTSRVDTWNARIQETVRLLRAGEAAQARSTIGPVLEEMTQEVNPGERAGPAFGLALTLRALAEAGSGNEHGAIWDWHVAQQLDASLESWDLREFGGAGELLARHRLSADPVPAAPTVEELEKSGAQGPTILRRGRQPGYVERSRQRRWTGAIVITVRIDAEGRPTYPRIAQGSHEVGMVLATCEYARELTFSPAMWGGLPVAALWDITVNYRLE